MLVTLTAAGWSGTAAPYSQTVAVSGVTEQMEPILVSALDDGATEAAQKAYSKALDLYPAVRPAWEMELRRLRYIKSQR